MFKKIALLLIASFSLISCYKPQNLNITVSGQVLDPRHRGVANVTILINQGLRVNMWPVAYEKYDSVLTDSEGRYSYLITEHRYYYEVCCKIPSQYSTVNIFCKEVDKTIIDSKRVPNVINFKLIP